jgi:hypothetical protein
LQPNLSMPQNLERAVQNFDIRAIPAITVAV